MSKISFKLTNFIHLLNYMNLDNLKLFNYKPL